GRWSTRAPSWSRSHPPSGYSGATSCAGCRTPYPPPPKDAGMRIVVVGLEAGDPLGATLARAFAGAQVVTAHADALASSALDGADVAVLAPACVARPDVIAVVD